MTKIIRGRTVRPTNADYNDPGGIHDDATAQELGFRGGTIAASAHLDTFVPVLLDVFGEEWFRTGSLSVYFRHATTDGEPTHALVEIPNGAGDVDDADHAAVLGAALVPLRDTQIRAVLEMSDGTLVGARTASIGSPNEPTALEARDLRHDPSAARILREVILGEVLGPFPAAVNGERLAQGCKHRITEVLDWYRGRHRSAGRSLPQARLSICFPTSPAKRSFLEWVRPWACGVQWKSATITARSSSIVCTTSPSPSHPSATALKRKSFGITPKHTKEEYLWHPHVSSVDS